jgi:hypothetical protein
VPSTLRTVSEHQLFGLLSIRFLVGQPLCGESRPFERTPVEHVVEEDGVLLPYLVLLVDDLVLDLLLVLHLASVYGVYPQSSAVV